MILKPFLTHELPKLVNVMNTSAYLNVRTVTLIGLLNVCNDMTIIIQFHDGSLFSSK